MNTQPIENYTYEEFKFLNGPIYDTDWTRSLTEDEFKSVIANFKYVMVTPLATHEGSTIAAQSIITSSLGKVKGIIFFNAHKREFDGNYIVRGVFSLEQPNSNII